MFKSQAHKKKMQELVKKGKIPQATYHEWEKATTGYLPERLKPKKNDKKPK